MVLVFPLATSFFNFFLLVIDARDISIPLGLLFFNIVFDNLSKAAFGRLLLLSIRALNKSVPMLKALLLAGTTCFVCMFLISLLYQ